MSIFDKDALRAKRDYLQTKKIPFFGGLILLALLGTILLFATRPARAPLAPTAKAGPVLVAAAPSQVGPGQTEAEPSLDEPSQDEPVLLAAGPAPGEPAEELAIPWTTAEPAPAQEEPAGPDGGQAEATLNVPGAASITLPKVDFRPGEPITPTLLGLAGPHGHLLVIAKIGAPDSEFEPQPSPQGDGPRLRAPRDPGLYEIRLYAGQDEPDAGNLVAKASISVSGQAQGAFKLEVAGTRFRPGQRVPVKVSAVPDWLIGDGALVGLYPKGAGPDQFRTYVAISETDEEFFLDLPLAARGAYEIRALSTDDPMTEEAVVAIVPIEVN
ncbi:MAG: hypothetical protein LBP92_08850 [Deltaproteobacteria bacterium]|jgi:hypothetical protein|nr:hypothetical protein [Deltaproteobacteria bacterium]